MASHTSHQGLDGAQCMTLVITKSRFLSKYPGTIDQVRGADYLAFGGMIRELGTKDWEGRGDRRDCTLNYRASTPKLNLPRIPIVQQATPKRERSRCGEAAQAPKKATMIE